MTGIVATPDWKRWFETEIPAGIDLDLPGIYEWRIANVGTYVGQSKRLRKRLLEYPNNVRKLILGLPYRKAKPEAYRFVHRELAAALEAKRSVVFAVLENCDLKSLNERERHWIALRGTLNR